jgi:acyl-CoA synthetase (AMP-forming)/AMP-acid ligase II
MILRRSHLTCLTINNITKTYHQIFNESRNLGLRFNIKPLETVAILAEKRDYTPALFSVWSRNGIAVPLSTTHPVGELSYYLSDCKASTLLISTKFKSIAKKLQENISLNIVYVDEVLTDTLDEPFSQDEQCDSVKYASEQNRQGDPAIIMYSSGTTGDPKGVVHTHGSLLAQCESLQKAWNYSSTDRILHTLPLHHIHGIVNGLLTGLYSQSHIELMDFEPSNVWSRLQSGQVSMFMGVPTMYSKLLRISPDEAKLDNVRLCISGSSSLPTPIKRKWYEKTGHVLLERYGMTEIGMALSCGIDIETRIDGSVGTPLPKVKVALFDKGQEIVGDDVDGEIWVSGPTVFQEYYNRPEQTAKEFVDRDTTRWFKTGDIASRSSKFNGSYFIKGRASVDIIKSGGYKISALEIEKQILLLDWVEECACLGIADDEWGERVACLIKTQRNVTLNDVRSELAERLATYKLPTLLKTIKDDIPRNSMGKVNKKQLKIYFT